MKQNKVMAEKKSKQAISDLANHTQDLGGAAIGALAGLSIANPILGAIIEAVTPVLVDAAQTLYGRRKQKVGRLVAYTAEKLKNRLDNGDELRDDDFFGGADPDISQLWDRVVENVSTESETKKIPYIGNMLTNICFESSIGREQANAMIKIINALTYQQLCLLSVFGNDGLKQSLYEGNYRGNSGNFSYDKIAVLTEILELHEIGIIVVPNDTMLGVSDVNPRRTNLQGLGKAMYRLMELNSIPSEDALRLVQYLAD